MQRVRRQLSHSCCRHERSPFRWRAAKRTQAATPWLLGVFAAVALCAGCNSGGGAKRANEAAQSTGGAEAGTSLEHEAGSADARSDAGSEVDASLSGGGLDAATTPGSNDVELGSVVDHLVDDVFVPSYESFEAAAKELNTSVSAFCQAVQSSGGSTGTQAGASHGDAGIVQRDAGPRQRDAGTMRRDAGAGAPPTEDVADARALLAEVRRAWERARSEWKKADAFAFGPYRDQPWRIGPKLDSYPVRVATVDAFFVNGGIDAGTLASQGTRVRGLPVIEYLLYAPGSAEATLSAFDGETGRLRCSYLQALGSDTHALATEMTEAWRDTYADEVKLAGSGSETFERLHDALSEIVNRMVFAIENLRLMKVGKPAGLGEDGEPLPELFESLFSNRAREDAHDALLGVWQVYSGRLWPDGFDGDVAVERDRGIRGTVLWRGPELDEAVISEFEAAFGALDESGSFVAVVAEDPTRLETVYEALRQLQLTFGVDVAAALGVTVTFNDTDGD